MYSGQLLLIHGRMGHGKTAYAVKCICAWLSGGGSVATNIPLNWDGVLEFCAARFNRVPSPASLHKVADDALAFEIVERLPVGAPDNPVLVVLDEATEFWDSKDRGNKGKDAGLRWIRQCRKVHHAVVVVAQDVTTLDHRLRGLANEIVCVRDLGKMRMMGVLNGPANQLLALHLDGSGKEIVHWEWMWRDALVYKAYNTFAVHGAAILASGMVVGSKQPPAVAVPPGPGRAAFWGAVAAGSLCAII